MEQLRQFGHLYLNRWWFPALVVIITLSAGALVSQVSRGIYPLFGILFVMSYLGVAVAVIVNIMRRHYRLAMVNLAVLAILIGFTA